MNMNRRQMIKGIGAAICAGASPSFIPSLIDPVGSYTRVGHEMTVSFDDADRFVRGQPVLIRGKDQYGEAKVEQIYMEGGDAIISLGEWQSVRTISIG